MEKTENIDQKEDEISLIDLLAVLIKHRWLIIIVTGLSALGVLTFAIGSLMLPNKNSYYPNYYKSKSILSINADSSSGLSMDSDISGLAALAGLSASSGPNIAAVANKYMLSDSFIDVIVKEFNLLEVYELTESKYPKTISRKMVRGNLGLTEDADSATIEISYKDVDKYLATDIVNKTAELLELKFQDTSSDETSIKKSLLEENLRLLENKINNLMDAFEIIQDKYGIYDINLFTTNHVESLLSFQSRLLSKEIEIEVYKENFNIEDPIVAKMEIERAGLQSGINKLKNGYTAENIIVPSEDDLPGLVREYKEISMDLNLQQKIYATLFQEYELVKLTALSTPPNFMVYEKAEVPEMKSGPSRAKLSIIVTMAMFFISIFIAFILEFIGNIKNNPDEMNKLKFKTYKRKKNEQN
jgi:tyrosine-protein kinase Etk/Wzc